MGSAFNNFERLAMTEEEFLRMSEADFMPTMARQPSFMQRMMGSPRPGSSSKRPTRTEFSSPSTSRSNSPVIPASPALSSISMNSPRPSTDATSPRSLWGGFGMRKRTNTTSSFASMGGVIAEANTKSSIDATIDPKLGEDDVRKSTESKRDTFGLPRAPWSPQLS